MTAASTTLRRLMKEAQELSASSSSPSPYFHAHPVSDSNLFDWHFTLAGPPAPSPYANGIYHGRIVLPAQYPLRPPSFRFLTPSGRFEVNREICLSISGHHDETWQPAWGIRTALIAIRSFMEGDAKGQVGGLDASDEARREWARLSRSWSCSVCSEGKSNEDILREWARVCGEKGVRSEGQENTGADGEEEASGGSGVKDEIPPELKFSYRDEMATAANANASTGTSTPPASTSTSTSNATSTPLRPAARSNPVTTTPSTRTPTNPRPLANTDTPLRSSRISDSAPWLDRAIVAVLIALVAMILKKIIYARAEL